MLEALIMREISGPRPVVDRTYDAGMMTTYATRRLDVLCGRLRLPADDHQSQTFHINADRDHVRREYDVVRPRLREGLALLRIVW